MHFDEKQLFYINLNINRFGSDVMIYYIIDVLKIKETYPRRSQLRFIFFFNKILKNC